MNLPIIQSLWIGEPLSNLEKLCIQSFIDNGHEFHLYVYEHIKNIPSGCIIKDGNEILPSDKIFHISKNRISPFSDYFRYTLLYKKGGWWVDMDTLCIKPFNFKQDIVFSNGRLDGGGGFDASPLKFPAEHPVMQELVAYCENFGAAKNYNDFYQLFSQAIPKYKLEGFAQPGWCFNPPINVFLDHYPNGIDVPDATHAVHVPNSKIVHYKFFSKNDMFSEHSLFELLKNKHRIKNLSDAKMISPLMITTARCNYELTKRKNRSRRKKNIVVITATLSFAIGLLIGLIE